MTTPISVRPRADKPILLTTTLAVLLLLAAAAGILARAKPALGAALVAPLGLAGAAASQLRPAAPIIAALPSLAGAVIGADPLIVLIRSHDAGGPTGRRRFLLLSAGPR